MVLSDELRATIHGNDERVPLKAIEDGVRFYLELISRN
jgi:acetylornithine deacetylase/succinyl-diaminopimelate desuccinylase-like protein